MSAEERLAELGIELPPAAEPKGLYRPLVNVLSTAVITGLSMSSK